MQLCDYLLHRVSEQFDQESSNKVAANNAASPLEIRRSKEEKRQKKKDKQTESEFKRLLVCVDSKQRTESLQQRWRVSVNAVALMMEQLHVFTPVLLGLTQKPQSHIFTRLSLLQIIRPSTRLPVHHFQRGVDKVP